CCRCSRPGAGRTATAPAGEPGWNACVGLRCQGNGSPTGTSSARTPSGARGLPASRLARVGHRADLQGVDVRARGRLGQVVDVDQVLNLEAEVQRAAAVLRVVDEKVPAPLRHVHVQGHLVPPAGDAGDVRVNPLAIALLVAVEDAELALGHLPHRAGDVLRLPQVRGQVAVGGDLHVLLDLED